MLNATTPSFNNALLVLMLLSFLGIAHAVALKSGAFFKSDIKNRIHVAWAIALVAMPAILYPKSIGLLLWAIVPIFAWQEWMTQAHRIVLRALVWWIGISLYALQLILILLFAQTHPWIVIVLPTVLSAEVALRRFVSRWISIGMLYTLILPAFALPLLVHARLSVLVWCFLIPQLFDAFQYLVGKTWGRTRLSRWSLKKTWEGLLGGALLAWLCAMALSPWLPWEAQYTAKTTPMLLIAAYLGGLASSRFKRTLGLKDWSCRLGSHGGVLDRMDSLIFSIPMAWFFYYSTKI